MTHLRAVPDEPDEPIVELAGPGEAPEVDAPDDPIDGAAAVAPDEEVGEPEGDVQPEEETRRIPSTVGGAFFLSILAIACGGVVIAARSDWRLGVQVLAGAMLAAAGLRLLLANRDAGMLAVRNRFVDVVLMGGAGVLLAVLATTIPDMPIL